MFQYAWAGLAVESPFELVDLAPLREHRAASDTVSIEVGAIPPELTNCRSLNARERIGRGIYVFHRPGVARYLVLDGKLIIIEPERDVQIETYAAFLLGRPFTAISYQRGWLSLHGSSIVRQGRAAVFVAPAGTGKSTLLAALEADGNAPLSDDAAVIRPEDAIPAIWPTSRSFRLRPDAATHLLSPDRVGHRVRPGLDKVAIPFCAQHSRPVPLGAVYLLERGGAQPMITPVGRLEAIQLLTDHTNRPRLAGFILGRARLFAELTRLATHIPVSRLRIPDDLERIQETAEMLRPDPLSSDGIDCAPRSHP